MDIVHPHVAGIDVHKKQITVAVRLPGGLAGERRARVRWTDPVTKRRSEGQLTMDGADIDR